MTSLLLKIRESRLARDSFWSVFGNGLGNVLLLLAGILIARLLQKDLYGEYGMVKTTMFYLAAFSTFGLGYTSTKFVAHAIEQRRRDTAAIVRSAMGITLVSCTVMCVLLLVFADRLAAYIDAPQLAPAFRYLGVIMICKAVSTTQTGILAGYKDFRSLGVNNIVSGAVLLAASVPLTCFYSVGGSLAALLLSQAVLCLFNARSLWRVMRREVLDPRTTDQPTNQPAAEGHYTRKILQFSFPVALQELSYTVCNWGAMLFVTKYAAIGEVGIYSAATQWGAIILFIPTLLQNVVLSYLSGLNRDARRHNRIVWQMIVVNLVCACIPLVFIVLLSGVIVSFYGATFAGLRIVLNVYALSTVPMCLANVLQADLLARGRNWLLFALRTGRDTVIITTVYLLFARLHTEHAALHLALVNVAAYSVFVVLLAVLLWRIVKADNISNRI